MVEVMIVLAIIMVISAMAAPNIISSLRLVKLRGATSPMINLFEQARMLAVRNNRGYVVKPTVVNGTTFWYISPNTTTAISTALPQVALPQGISLAAAPPSQTSLGNSIANPNSYTNPNQDGPAFNSRGLPCYVNAAESGCQNFVSPNYANFVYYLQDNGFGGTLYTAITISPTGKIKAWNWDGSSWK